MFEKKMLTGCLCGLMLSLCFAEEPTLIQPPSLNARDASWTFMGVMASEEGESYPYYFHMEHHDSGWHADVVLIDGIRQKTLLEEHSDAVATSPVGLRRTVGHTFLSFNPINNHWLFGIKDTLGFSFKADMIQQGEHPAYTQLGHEFFMSTYSVENTHGHVFLNPNIKDGAFVSAHQSWFQAIWNNTVLQKISAIAPIESLFCQIENGGVFYNVRWKDKRALRGGISAWSTKDGEHVRVSQFVDVIKKNAKQWFVAVHEPKLYFSFNNLSQDLSLRLGLTKKDNKQVFCSAGEYQPLVVNTHS